MKFDDEAVIKALPKNSDEQWEETVILMIQTLLRSIKKYSHIETKSNELLDFSWTSSTLLILEVIKNGSQDII